MFWRLRGKGIVEKNTANMDCAELREATVTLSNQLVGLSLRFQCSDRLHITDGWEVWALTA